ncbi:MAG: pyrroline-5-carboxylate reductase [Armatimonadetes bacterium]|nr:pyrroline-5-carboxylate reductase [Armatimonadota bacterium]
MSDNIGRLTIIGAGAMGSTFAAGVISAGLVRAEDVTLTDVDVSRLDELRSNLGVSVALDNAAAVNGADVVLIAVKPAVVSEVLDQIAGVITSKQLIISVAAGVRLESIESRLPSGAKVIRSMPNTPCRIGVGAIGFARGRFAKDADVGVASRIFDAVGMSFEVPEKLLNAVTGLSGSGPAYVFMLIEALSDGGVRMGLPREVSTKLAAQTVMGAARMVLEENEHPARLKDQVTSPGGTTIAGIEVLERAGFRSALIEAVKAAAERADELG